MTRRRMIVVLTGAALLLALAVLVPAARSVLPSETDAARSAQVAADRVAPGVLRVTGAQWRGEAGGYRIDAVLVARAPRSVGWTGDRRCEPGSYCEQSLRTLLAALAEYP